MKVITEWDEEAQVYVATSDDVPGLVTEADSLDELVKKLEVMIPELFKLNGYAPSPTKCRIELQSKA